MKHGDAAWTTLACGVLVYELTAPPNELLSEAMDRYRARHPLVAGLTVVYLAAHLLRIWPQRIDPLHQFATRIGQRR